MFIVVLFTLLLTILELRALVFCYKEGNHTRTALLLHVTLLETMIGPSFTTSSCRLYRCWALSRCHARRVTSNLGRFSCSFDDFTSFLFIKLRYLWEGIIHVVVFGQGRLQGHLTKGEAFGNARVGKKTLAGKASRKRNVSESFFERDAVPCPRNRVRESTCTYSLLTRRRNC